MFWKSSSWRNNCFGESNDNIAVYRRGCCFIDYCRCSDFPLTRCATGGQWRNAVPSKMPSVPLGRRDEACGGWPKFARRCRTQGSCCYFVQLFNRNEAVKHHLDPSKSGSVFGGSDENSTWHTDGHSCFGCNAARGNHQIFVTDKITAAGII